MELVASYEDGVCGGDVDACFVGEGVGGGGGAGEDAFDCGGGAEEGEEFVGVDYETTGWEGGVGWGEEGGVGVGGEEFGGMSLVRGGGC